LVVLTVAIVGVTAAWAAAPTVTSFTPTSGVVGTTVMITGAGFEDTSAVTAVAFNGVPATFTLDSDTQITATVPSTATTGPITVTDPEGTATSSTSFTVNQSPMPTIASFDPSHGAVKATVTITGTGFIGATDVEFNGTPASFTVPSDTQTTATVPQGATTGPISITTPGGTAASSTDFTVDTTTVKHRRSVSLHLRNHLIVYGRVWSGFAACKKDVAVKVQFWVDGHWRTVKVDETNVTGAYSERIPDRPGRYRALVSRQVFVNDVCPRDLSPERSHRH
jgi:hypothetical protein